MRDITKIVKICLILLLIVITGCNNNRFKRYVIEHRDDIVYSGDNYFRIDSCDLKYYENVTIGMHDNNAYYMVFWGDRDSWQYQFRKDKHFQVDVKYERSKGRHVYNDLGVLYSLELAKLKKK